MGKKKPGALVRDAEPSYTLKTADICEGGHYRLWRLPGLWYVVGRAPSPGAYWLWAADDAAHRLVADIKRFGDRAVDGVVRDLYHGATEIYLCVAAKELKLPPRG